MNYYLALLNAINEYSGKEDQAKHIRELICFISDNSTIEKTDDLKELLFEASQLIRVFGYNKLNKIDFGKTNDGDDLSKIKTRLIFDHYRTKSDSNAFLDKKQKNIIDTFQSLEVKRIFVSAPTSFGKTHILKEIIFLNSDCYKNIVLIFPTVALLVENMDSITEFVELHQLNYEVSTSFTDNIEEGSRNIFVLTPERAIAIFEETPKIDIDFFFFDEVYKIDEDFNSSDDYDDISSPILPVLQSTLLPYSRAVAFRLVLYFLANNASAFYLAGPYINLDRLKPGMNTFIEKFNVEKILIDTETTLKSYISAWSSDITVENSISGAAQLSIDGYNKSLSIKDKIKLLCAYISENNLGQTLVYCDNPARTLERANNLIKQDIPLSADLHDLIEHLKNRYSVNITSKNGSPSYSEWSLLGILGGGVGVHHGKLPKYVQKEILRLFNNGDLSTLFCTSTLIEGVNTKAKNIIVSSSTIRDNKDLNQFDIKNIIGRAGRYYHHFLGRVFFIESEQVDVLDGPDQMLNFALFDNVGLSAEDFDNVTADDLWYTHKAIKSSRDASFNKDAVPDSVFVKNRLFDRKKQEALISIIERDFDKYNLYFEFMTDAKSLLEQRNFGFTKLFLSSLFNADIISEYQEKGHLNVIRSYSYGGIINLIEYEINYSKSTVNVDAKYASAFNKSKTIIEYQLPRYLTLLQALYNHICEKRKLEEDKVDLTRLIRFFETGAESLAGLYLIEYGMPAGVVRDIERMVWGIKTMSLDDGLDAIRNSRVKVISQLDAFELKVFSKLV